MLLSGTPTKTYLWSLLASTVAPPGREPRAASPDCDRGNTERKEWREDEERGFGINSPSGIRLSDNSSPDTGGSPRERLTRLHRTNCGDHPRRGDITDRQGEKRRHGATVIMRLRSLSFSYTGHARNAFHEMQRLATAATRFGWSLCSGCMAMQRATKRERISAVRRGRGTRAQTLLEDRDWQRRSLAARAASLRSDTAYTIRDHQPRFGWGPLEMYIADSN